MLERDLLFVTGKGGTGKTTVAAALGVAASECARRALVCDLVGGQPVAVAVSERLSVAHIEPRAAFTEWMREQPGGAVAATVLGHSAAFAQFVDAAPGAKELVTIGKAVDLASSGGYGVVIADGPSTGHALAMLRAPRTVASVAHVGPIAVQARGVERFLRDPDRTGYAGVALPEELPLHELLELDAGLRETVGRGLDLIVVNGVYPDRFSDEEAERLHAVDGRGPVGAALAEHRRARAHSERVAWLRDRTATPIVTLPFVFGELDADELASLARRFVVSRVWASGVRRPADRARPASWR